MKNLHSISCYNHTAIESELSKKENMIRFIRNLQFANNDIMRNVYSFILHSFLHRMAYHRMFNLFFCILVVAY